MSRTILISLVLLAGAALCAPFAPFARADENVSRELRLLYFDGKFGEARELLDAAPPEVRDDVELRRALGDAATKWYKRQEGLARKPGLIAARDAYAAARALDPTDTKSVESALEATRLLIDVAKEAKNGEHAQLAAAWGIAEAEKALAGGADTATIRMGLADAYAVRAAGGHPVNDFEQIVTDYGRGAELIAACAAESPKPAEAYSRAAQICLDLGAFVNEYRPIDEETRDEEATMQGVEYASLACAQKNAPDEAYSMHLVALRAAHRLGITEGLPRVFMDPLPKKEQIGKLDLRIPRSSGWKKNAPTTDWPDVWSRQIGDDDTAMQIIVKEWSHGQSTYGKPWSRLEDCAKTRFDIEKQKMDDVASSVDPAMVDPTPPAPDDGKKKRKKRKPKKGGAEIWHWEIAGTDQNRARRMAEWIWYPQKKDGFTYQLRVVDWRKTPDLNEPDIVAFVQQALGLAPPDPEEDGGKKKGRR